MNAASVVESFREISERLRKMEMVVAAHPDDLTDELRGLIAATPLTTLRESRYVEPGKLYVIHPGLLTDLTEAPSV